MKGGLAVMLAALDRGRSSPLRDALGYEVVINSDEETGSLGSAALIARARARQGRGADLRAGAARRDCSPARGRAPAISRSSCTVAARMPAAIPRTAATRSSPPPTSRCGSPRRAAPGLTRQPGADRRRRAQQRRARSCRAARQHAPGDACGRSARAQALSTPRSPTVAAEHDVTIDLPRRLQPPAQADRRRQRSGCSRWSAIAAPTLGQSIALAPTGGVCDGNNIAACGVPVVDTMGARGGAIHSADEFLIVDSLAERARALRAGAAADSPSGAAHDASASAPSRDRRSRGALRDGQDDRRRLHQPAARSRCAARQARPAPPPASRATEETTGDDLFVLMLENVDDAARCAAPARSSRRSASTGPFYCYRIGTLTPAQQGARPHLPRRDAAR